MRRRRTVGALAAVLALGCASSARASSIVYVCAPNLCRIDPAHPKQVTRLTRDGKAGGPVYLSPSLSTKGTKLSFVKGNRLYLAQGNATHARRGRRAGRDRGDADAARRDAGGLHPQRQHDHLARATPTRTTRHRSTASSPSCSHAPPRAPRDRRWRGRPPAPAGCAIRSCSRIRCPAPAPGPTGSAPRRRRRPAEVCERMVASDPQQRTLSNPAASPDGRYLVGGGRAVRRRSRLHPHLPRRDRAVRPGDGRVPARPDHRARRRHPGLLARRQAGRLHARRGPLRRPGRPVGGPSSCATACATRRGARASRRSRRRRRHVDRPGLAHPGDQAPPSGDRAPAWQARFRGLRRGRGGSARRAFSRLMDARWTRSPGLGICLRILERGWSQARAWRERGRRACYEPPDGPGCLASGSPPERVPPTPPLRPRFRYARSAFRCLCSSRFARRHPASRAWASPALSSRTPLQVAAPTLPELVDLAQGRDEPRKATGSGPGTKRDGPVNGLKTSGELFDRTYGQLTAGADIYKRELLGAFDEGRSPALGRYLDAEGEADAA